HHRSVDEGSEGLEEERRLFYVAVTRTRDELYMCRPVKSSRGRGRRMEIRRSSTFVDELRDSEELDEVPWEKWIIEE
ncbi:MAG: 3'-5' exonuclease, partial [Bradymonadaceae bacterium]